ncbi:hypothetical protein AAMO2058_000676200 [Amorphochlora amoebiformis]
MADRKSASSPPRDSHVILEAKGLHFTYETTGRKVLHGVSLEMEKGAVVGVLGRNEAGKSTVARILSGKVTPDKGRILFKGLRVDAPGTPYWAMGLYVAIIAAVAGAANAVYTRVSTSGLREELNRGEGHIHPAFLIGNLLLNLLSEVVGWWVVPILILVAIGVSEYAVRVALHEKACKDIRENILHVTSEDSPGFREFRDDTSIFDALCRRMPLGVGKSMRREKAIALLQAGGLQLYDQRGKPYGNASEYINTGVPIRYCSGGQRHLIYVLSMVAGDPDVIIADEILIGLDIQTQARV